MKDIALEIMFKLHKNSVKTRPVGRAAACQMKTWEGLVGGHLGNVLEDSEREKAKNGRKERPTLNNSRYFVRELEDLNVKWETDATNGRDLEGIVELLTWDIAAMYPSLKREFIIREIDGALVKEWKDLREIQTRWPRQQN